MLCLLAAPATPRLRIFRLYLLDIAVDAAAIRIDGAESRAIGLLEFGQRHLMAIDGQHRLGYSHADLLKGRVFDLLSRCQHDAAVA